MTFEDARAQFPVLERYAYLNAGTNGPLARATVEAVEQRLRADLDGGRGGIPYFERMLELREEARARLAALLGVAAGHVALTYSTTDACNVVLGGLELGPDDEIVTTDEEHFGLLGPLHASGARVVVVEADEQAIAGAVGPRTKLVAVSHVTWVGTVLPVERLRELGPPILVDGAQSVGAIAVDASSFDFYTVSCQKWLCGPDATGALYIRDPERIRIARPTYLSQASYEPTGRFVPREGAQRFDTGWVPPPSLAGLCAAIDTAPGWRHERALEAARLCHDRLAARFDVVTERGRATLVSWRVEDDAGEATRRCFEHGVIVRDLPGRGVLRASCGYWTSDEDIERLVNAL